uniref:Uncharacterized protein n=1 Tax=Anguilla anguilla TaxID=7936 RepID=A0A0E9VKY0_ANGAN
MSRFLGSSKEPLSSHSQTG